jgi:hypothetical protein
MKYVYILESLDSQHFYVGITDDLRAISKTQRRGSRAHLQIRALADKDLCRVQGSRTGHRLREILEVGFRPGICEETPLMLNGVNDNLKCLARNAHDD